MAASFVWSYELLAGETSVLAKVTAYCPCDKCCGSEAIGLPSRGRAAYLTFGAAVAPANILYGSVIKVPGAGEYLADDTGGAMRQDAEKGVCHIDIRVASYGSDRASLERAHQWAKRWGVRWLKITIVSSG